MTQKKKNKKFNEDYDDNEMDDSDVDERTEKQRLKEEIRLRSLKKNKKTFE